MKKKMKNNYIVFGIEHYNTLGLIRSLGEKGIKPIYIAIKNKADIAILSKYTKKYYLVASPEEGYRVLLKLHNQSSNNLVFTIDDKVTELLNHKYDEIKDKFIFFNASEKDRVSKYMNKNEISSLAESCGLKVLKYQVCKRNEMPKKLHYPVITKSLSSTIGGWKSDVFICKNESELKKAYKKIKAHIVFVQEYIKKKNEYCIEGFSINKGEDAFFSIASTYNYNLPDYYSPYMTVQNMNNKELKEKLSLLLKKIKFEGIFEIEFIIDKNDNYYFSEINFRNSTWSYASTIAGMNLPFYWAKGMINNKIDKDCYSKIKKPFTAMVEPIDYQKRVIESNYDINKWLKDVRECKCLYYYGKGDDLSPFYSMIENNKELR